MFLQADIPEEEPIEKEDSTIQEEPELEAAVEKEAPEEECLVLEGDSDPNVLVVNSQTELIPSPPSVTPKFEIVEAEKVQEEAAAPEPVAGKFTDSLTAAFSLSSSVDSL